MSRIKDYEYIIINDKTSEKIIEKKKKSEFSICEKDARECIKALRKLGDYPEIKKVRDVVNLYQFIDPIEIKDVLLESGLNNRETACAFGTRLAALFCVAYNYIGYELPDTEQTPLIWEAVEKANSAFEADLIKANTLLENNENISNDAFNRGMSKIAVAQPQSIEQTTNKQQNAVLLTDKNQNNGCSAFSPFDLDKFVSNAAEKDEAIILSKLEGISYSKAKQIIEQDEREGVFISDIKKFVAGLVKDEILSYVDDIKDHYTFEIERAVNQLRIEFGIEQRPDFEEDDFDDKLYDEVDEIEKEFSLPLYKTLGSNKIHTDTNTKEKN